MKTRSLEIEDVPVLTELHQKFYPDLKLPDFTKGLCSFVIEDSNPICFGAVQTFAEVSLITDKSQSKRDRREALYRVLDIASYIARQHGYTELHIFTNDEKYVKVLTKRGFNLAGQNALVIDI